MRDSLIRVIYLRCGGKLRRSGRPPFTENETLQAFDSLYLGRKHRMSRKEQLVYASNRQILVFGIAIFAALIAVYSWQRNIRSKRAGWPSAQVPLSEFRTMPVQVLETQHGTRVVYQAEAHVGYVVEGKQYRLWLPILSRSDSQQLLQFELSNLVKTSCYVHWDQARPDYSFLTCDQKNFGP
jgi:hypothetical protein